MFSDILINLVDELKQMDINGLIDAPQQHHLLPGLFFINSFGMPIVLEDQDRLYKQRYLTIQELVDEPIFSTLSQEKKAILCALLLSNGWHSDDYFMYRGFKEYPRNFISVVIDKFIADAESAKLMLRYLGFLRMSKKISGSYSSSKEFVDIFHRKFPQERIDWENKISVDVCQENNGHFLLLSLDRIISSYETLYSNQGITFNIHDFARPLFISLKKLYCITQSNLQRYGKNDATSLEHQVLLTTIKTYIKVLEKRYLLHRIYPNASQIEHASDALAEFRNKLAKLRSLIHNLHYECINFYGCILVFDINFMIRMMLLSLVVSVALCCASLLSVYLTAPMIGISILGCASTLFYKYDQRTRLALKEQCVQEIDILTTAMPAI